VTYRNCLTFALSVWRYSRTSDSLVIRRSHWGWFPHFSALFELEGGLVAKWEYVPAYPRPRWIPPLFFKGRVVKTYYQQVKEIIHEAPL